MSQEIEWLTSNTQIDYPFRAAVNTPSGLEAFVADAYVAHGLKYAALAAEITYLDFQAVPSDSDITVKFTNGVIILSGTSCLYTDFGRWRVMEWRSSTAIVRLVVDKDDYASFVGIHNVVGGELESRVVHRRPDHLESIDIPTLVTGLTGGPIELVSGYNVNLLLDAQADIVDTTFFDEALGVEEDVRPRSRIKIEAVPGGGIGYEPCDAADLAVKTIGGFGPDDLGDLSWDAQGCYWTEIPVGSFSSAAPGAPFDYYAYTIPATIRFHNDCEPCCDCDDYVNVYKAMKRLWGVALQASARIKAARRRYQELAAVMQQEKVKRESPKVKMFARMDARPDYMFPCFVIIMNDSRVRIKKVDWDIKLTGTGEIAVLFSTFDSDCSRMERDALVGSQSMSSGAPVGDWEGDLTKIEYVSGARWIRLYWEAAIIRGMKAGSAFTADITATVDFEDCTQVILTDTLTKNAVKPLRKGS